MILNIFHDPQFRNLSFVAYTGLYELLFLQFLLEDARSNETVPKSPTKSHIPSSLDASADTTVTLPLRRHSPKEIDDKGKFVCLYKVLNKITIL